MLRLARTWPDGPHHVRTDFHIPNLTAAGRITDAADAVAVMVASKSLDVQPLDDAKNDLQIAVDDARDIGMTWGSIGDFLGIRRGAAIKRYHVRSQGILPDHPLLDRPAL